MPTIAPCRGKQRRRRRADAGCAAGHDRRPAVEFPHAGETTTTRAATVGPQSRHARTRRRVRRRRARSGRPRRDRFEQPDDVIGPPQRNHQHAASLGRLLAHRRSLAHALRERWCRRPAPGGSAASSRSAAIGTSPDGPSNAHPRAVRSDDVGEPGGEPTGAAGDALAQIEELAVTVQRARMQELARNDESDAQRIATQSAEAAQVAVLLDRVQADDHREGDRERPAPVPMRGTRRPRRGSRTRAASTRFACGAAQSRRR